MFNIWICRRGTQFSPWPNIYIFYKLRLMDWHYSNELLAIKDGLLWWLHKVYSLYWQVIKWCVIKIVSKYCQGLDPKISLCGLKKKQTYFSRILKKTSQKGVAWELAHLSLLISLSSFSVGWMEAVLLTHSRFFWMRGHPWRYCQCASRVSALPVRV